MVECTLNEVVTVLYCKMLVFVVFTSILFQCTIPVHSARILCFFPVNLYSHQVVYQKVWRELSLRGHEVVVLTPMPINDKSLVNLKEIDLSDYENTDIMNEFKENVPPQQLVKFMVHYLKLMIQDQFSHPEVRSLITSKYERFDLVLGEWLYPTAAFFSGHFKCPLVGISSFGTSNLMYPSIGNPIHPVLTPDLNLPYFGEMTFFQRLHSTYYTMWLKMYNKFFMIPTLDAAMRKYFENAPYLEDLANNISLLILNVNPVLFKPRPNVPNVIEIGGLNIAEPKPLPKDIQLFLDEADNGVIYMSLGTIVKTSWLTNKTKNIIFETFKELPFKILWKTEEENVHYYSQNIKIMEWLPQQDILAHPNMKLFITHGGLQSIDEAIYNKVPMIVMPYLGDQLKNAEILSQLGIAINLDIHRLSKNIFKSSIMKVLSESRYYRRIEELPEVMKDRPQSALNTTIWWIEYIIRHKGAKHLRSPIIDIPWYQYLLADVVGFALICLVFLVACIFKLTIFLYNFCKVRKLWLAQKTKIL